MTDQELDTLADERIRDQAEHTPHHRNEGLTSNRLAVSMELRVTPLCG